MCVFSFIKAGMGRKFYILFSSFRSSHFIFANRNKVLVFIDSSAIYFSDVSMEIGNLISYFDCSMIWHLTAKQKYENISSKFHVSNVSAEKSGWSEAHV